MRFPYHPVELIRLGYLFPPEPQSTTKSEEQKYIFVASHSLQTDAVSIPSILSIKSSEDPASTLPFKAALKPK